MSSEYRDGEVVPAYPGGSGPKPPHDGWMRQFLRAEGARQTMLLSRLAQRLERDLEGQPAGLPSREFVRVARLYLDGYRQLAALELEHAKVRLEAERVARGMPPMTDEEYAAANAEIARAGLPELADTELEQEVARRRRTKPMVLAAVKEVER